ncbi:hypothetical protein H1R20_g13976, partial [Candolleomyces eurysporus]
MQELIMIYHNLGSDMIQVVAAWEVTSDTSATMIATACSDKKANTYTKIWRKRRGQTNLRAQTSARRNTRHSETDREDQSLLENCDTSSKPGRRDVRSREESPSGILNLQSTQILVALLTFNLITMLFKVGSLLIVITAAIIYS